MANIVIALSRTEESSSIRSILIRNGFRTSFVVATGAQAISQMEDLEDGILISAYKLKDMLYSELYEHKSKGFEMLLMASQKMINECYGNDIVCLAMPLKVDDLINTINMMVNEQARRKKREKLKPRTRSAEDENIIKEAKKLLMTRNHMNEDEAHRYIQKSSMDTGTGLVETAKMILALMR